MKHLKTIKDSDVFPDYQPAGKINYKPRTAARVIVEDEEGRIALLAVTKKNYHKLPGGGVEEGEDIPLALAREIMEEIGCVAEVTGEVGRIVEYRNREVLEQESLCYRAKLVGEKGAPHFTEEEKAGGFAILWVENLETAIALLENDQPIGYNGQFIRERDLTFLQEARRLA